MYRICQNFSLVFAVALLTAMLIACTKESSSEREIANPDSIISEVPAIELLAVAPTSLQAHSDSIVFTIRYTDGDGDLGSDDPDANSVELTDNRNPDDLIFSYHLSPRAPAGTMISIQGELAIILDNSILLDENSDSEQTTFSIRIRDRAGNWSNTVETETVTIGK